MRKAYYLPTILVFIVFYIILVWQAPSSWSTAEPDDPTSQQTAESSKQASSMEGIIVDLSALSTELADQVIAFEHIYFTPDPEITRIYQVREDNTNLFNRFSELSNSLQAIPDNSFKNDQAKNEAIHLTQILNSGQTSCTKWHTMLADLQYILDQEDEELLMVFIKNKLAPSLEECRDLSKALKSSLDACQNTWSVEKLNEESGDHSKPKTSRL